MKTSIKHFLFICSVAFLSSCTDVVQIKLDEGSKLYVIDAFVNDLRADQTIRVTTSASYFSNVTPPAVPNASVILKDLTTNAIYNFTYTSNGNYVYSLATTDTISKVGHQYQLNVTIDGSIYTSLCLQKRTAIFDSINAIYHDGTGGFGHPKPYYECFLWARDIADQNPDYYWIKTYRNDTLFADPGDLNTAVDGTGAEVAVTGLGVDTMYFTPPAVFLGRKRYHSGDKCKVEIHSISRQTNDFLIQAVTQIGNGGLFATTPENVKTNITTPSSAKIKGVGWFNMATVVTKTKVIP